MKPEQEPKYDVDNFKRIMNRETCESIPDDEPIFILRAKDKNAALTIAYYKKLCIDETHRDTVNRRLHDFVEFAHNHPERMREPR
jgi:hypothetical protein